MKTIFLFFILSFNAIALPTKYQWIKESEELSSGKCYEVDKETSGNKFIKKANANSCKPDKTLYVFNLRIGKCFEVDKETEGNFYYHKIKNSHCKPEKTRFIIGKFLNNDGCFEVDEKTRGQLFFDKTDMDNCSHKKSLFSWEFKSLEYGNCYQISESDPTIKAKVKDDNCKPSSPDYNFIKQKPTRGICLEQHPSDYHLYSKKVQIKKCRPSKTIYVFYRDPNELKGHCYEIDEATKGEKYIDQVKIEICKSL